MIAPLLIDTYVQRVKQAVRRLVGEPYVGKRLKMRDASRALARLGLTPAQVLDAGCEDATFIYWLADLFPAATVLGVDLDVQAIAACLATRPRRYADRVNFMAAAFADLPAGTFDLVTAFDVLEHIPDDAGALTQLHCAMKPGGTLLVHVPRDQWIDHRGNVHRVPDEEAWRVNPGHVRTGYAPDQLAVLVESAGFHVRQIELWVRRWGAFAFTIYTRLEHPILLRALTIPVTDVCSLLDRRRPQSEGNTVWLVATA